MKWYVDLLVASVGESALFSAGSAAAAIGGMFILGVPFLDGLGFVLLVVSAGLMLIGGALSFISPGNVKLVNTLTKAKLNPGPDDYRRNRNKAALYALTGVLLFVYSLVLAAVLA
ncbi:MAG: hypothetical protein KGI38_08190 [Thaumarchaeota archaeon]|nr:hypothetical protein [Nitrososphaerota archaeon]